MEERLRTLRDKEICLNVQRAEHGGNKIADLEKQIAAFDGECARRMVKAEGFAKLLAKAGLDPV